MRLLARRFKYLVDRRLYYDSRRRYAELFLQSFDKFCCAIGKEYSLAVMDRIIPKSILGSELPASDLSSNLCFLKAQYSEKFSHLFS